MLLSSLVSVVIFFAVGELLSRTYNLPDRMNGFPRRLYVATDDPSPAYLLRPGVVTRARGVSVRVNAFGLRGPETSAVPATGVRRVLALGDSATFGEGVPEEDTFPVRLERELQERTRQRWEVLNSGVGGFNTADELHFLRTRGLALRPEAVVVGFNLNDIDHAPVINALGLLSYDREARASTWSPAHVSEFYLVLRWLLIMRGRLITGRPGIDVPFDTGQPFHPTERAVSAMRRHYYAHPNDDRWGTMVDALRGLGETTRQRGIRLVIAIIPDGDQLEGPEPGLVPQQKLLAICADAALDCLDLYPAFVAAGSVGLHHDIMHPNAAGQRVIAHALAERLASEGSGGG